MSLPNILTIFRLCLIPVFLVLYTTNEAAGSEYVAMAILIVAFLTDALDGFIARKYKKITNLGKVLDPIADKLLQMSILVCVAVKRPIIFGVVIFVFIKDVLLGIGALILYKSGNIVSQSNWGGKICCFIGFVCSLILIFPKTLPMGDVWVIVLGAVIVAANIMALVSYSVTYVKTRRVIKGKTK